MLNYSNLSDYDFECLAKDVMERKLGLELRVFGRGKDGGIDVCDNVTGKKTLIQVKHYLKSKPSDLLRALKAEVDKVRKIRPKQYYIFTSCDLNPQTVREIQSLFTEYMPTSKNIITIAEINDFLENQDNQDILRKHFKLWLTSTNVLDFESHRNIWLDSQDLLQSAKNNLKMYVETRFFQPAYNLLEKERVLLLLGPPGIGKTTTSEMLVTKFAAQGYRVRYASNSLNLEDLKKSLSADPETKEIILLDDCFGQCYFRMHDNQDKEMMSLIRTTRLHPGKVLLLNSRITIYNEAKAQGVELAKTIDNGDLKINYLELTSLSTLERAQILYNHLFFHEFTEPYWQAIRNQENYLKIILHSNYTPRIIEFVTRQIVKEQISADQYIEYVKAQLDNPEQIWLNEFEQRLQEPDRLLLTTLYSLTENLIEEEVLQSCYNKRLEYRNEQASINQYKTSMRRLSEAFLAIVDRDNSSFIRVSNPSVNDFLQEYLSSNQSEIDEIKKTIGCVNQIARLYAKDRIKDWRNNDELKRRIENGEALEWFYPSSSSTKALAIMVAHFGIKSKIYTDAIKDFLRNPTSTFIGGLSFPAEDAIVELSKSDMVDFYQLEAQWKNIESLTDIISGIQLSRMTRVINNVEQFFTGPKTREEFLGRVFEELEEANDDFLMFPSDRAIKYGEIVNEARLSLSTPSGSLEDLNELKQEVSRMILNNVQNEYRQIIDILPDDVYEHFIENSTTYLDEESYTEYARELVEDYLKQDEEQDIEKEKSEIKEMETVHLMFSN